MRYGRGIVGENITVELSTYIARRRIIERWNIGSKILALEGLPSTSSIFVLKETAVIEDYLQLMVGLYAHTPKRVPALFPSTTIGTDLCLTALALNGKYWAEMPLDTLGQSYVLKWPASQVTPSWPRFD